MLTSLYEWKIFEWHDKLQTKRRNQIYLSIYRLINLSIFLSIDQSIDEPVYILLIINFFRTIYVMFLLILWEGCLHVNLTFTGKSLILKPCENHLYCRLEVIVFAAMRSEQTVPWHLLMIVKLSIVKITLENGVADFKGLKFLSFNRVFVCLFVFLFV